MIVLLSYTFSYTAYAASPVLKGTKRAQVLSTSATQQHDREKKKMMIPSFNSHPSTISSIVLRVLLKTGAASVNESKGT